MYRVADIMTRQLVTLKPTDDLALAESILALGRFRHLPVVEDGRLLGLITHRDLLSVWAKATALGQRLVPAREVMQTNLATATPDTPVFEVAHLMHENKFGCMPVVERGRLVGIVTEADFLLLAAKLAKDATGPSKPLNSAHEGHRRIT